MKKTVSTPPDESWKVTMQAMFKTELMSRYGKPLGSQQKQRPPSSNIKDLIDDLPQMLKDLGIMNCLQTILTNLYLMKPRPEDPCNEIHELLEEALASSTQVKTEKRLLERERCRQLVLEFRIRQEIGKLKALCHFLLPEEYGPNGVELSPGPDGDELPSAPAPLVEEQDTIIVQLEEEKVEAKEDASPFSTVELNKKLKKGDKGGSSTSSMKKGKTSSSRRAKLPKIKGK